MEAIYPARIEDTAFKKLAGVQNSKIETVGTSKVC